MEFEIYVGSRVKVKESARAECLEDKPSLKLVWHNPELEVTIIHMEPLKESPESHLLVVQTDSAEFLGMQTVPITFGVFPSQIGPV